jgi:hypothetical protein
MGPPQYYPPQKKGMPGWAIALIVCAVLFVVMIMGLAAIPLIVSNDRDARRAEGEQLMGSARDYLRVEYSKTGNANDTYQKFRQEAGRHTFEGKYYRVDPNPGPSQNMGYDARVTCSPNRSSSDGKGAMDFNWADGNSTISWR